MDKRKRQKLTLEALPQAFTVCQLADWGRIDPAQPFCFMAATDRELSLVCPTERVPANTLTREDGWRAFRVTGTLDFSLVGILAGITGVLAREGIPVFALSTFDTDYLLTREKDFSRAVSALAEAGYAWMGGGWNGS